MKNQPTLVIIDDPNNIDELFKDISNNELIAYDSETTGVHKGAEVIGVSFCMDENKAYYLILSKWNPETKKLEYCPGMKEATETLLKLLIGRSLLMHNGVFDCSMAEDYFKVRLIESLHTDTMVLAHLIDENRPIGLKALGVSIFGENADEEAKLVKASVLANGGGITKSNYELYKADSKLIAKYGAKDALLTYKLFMRMLPQLHEEGLEKFFYEESMPLLRGPTYEMNTTGLKVDQVALTTLKKTLEAECAEAKAYIYQEIQPYIKDKYPGTNKKNTFNIGASQQMSWLVFGAMGLEFNTVTKGAKDMWQALNMKRRPYSPSDKRLFIHLCEQAEGTILQPASTVNGKKVNAKKIKAPWAYISADKEALKKHAPRYKWIEKFLEYQKKQKILKTYIEGIEERVQYGIIRPSFLQTGTTSGRYSSRNINFQNLPRDDKRIKSCIVSRPGKVFVGADYSQLEPRVFAYFSSDERLLAAFRGDDDFYSVIGIEVFGKTDAIPKKDGSPDAFGVKYKSLRDISKVISLSSTYGSTAYKLAPTVGKSVEDTQQIIDNYFEEFPGVKKMMLQSHIEAKRDGYVSNLFGRKRHMPEAKKIDKIYGKKDHGDLPYEARNILNLAVNHRIQSTGASICNRAMIALYTSLRAAVIDNAKFVSQVHDSIILECNEADAENVALLLQDAMESTVVLPGVILEAIPQIGKSLDKV
jgi:DNA polymerase I-like protein with 3'-5' exonuclease and polymerase domains